MTRLSTDRTGSERDEPTVDRRTVLAALGAALGAGCLGGVRDGGGTDAEPTLPATVTGPSFSRVERGGDYRLAYRWRALGRR